MVFVDFEQVDESCMVRPISRYAVQIVCLSQSGKPLCAPQAKKWVILISVNYGGVIVNTGGWVRGSGYDSLKHAAGSFEGMWICQHEVGQARPFIWWKH